MRDFFKPWRRKFGVVTLVMACVTTSVWIRGLAVTDIVNFPNFNQFTDASVKITRDRIVSERNLFAWERDVERFSDRLREDGVSETLTMKKAFEWITTKGSVVFDGGVLRVWRFAGCSLYWIEVENGPHYGVVITAVLIHPLSIILPVTLLSAYLLLSRQPTVEQTKYDL